MLQFRVMGCERLKEGTPNLQLSRSTGFRPMPSSFTRVLSRRALKAADQARRVLFSNLAGLGIGLKGLQV